MAPKSSMGKKTLLELGAKATDEYTDRDPIGTASSLFDFDIGLYSIFSTK